MESRTILMNDNRDAVPTWIVTSLKDVNIELVIVCPLDLFRRLEFAAMLVGWVARLRGLNLKLTVRLNPTP